MEGTEARQNLSGRCRPRVFLRSHASRPAQSRGHHATMERSCSVTLLVDGVIHCERRMGLGPDTRGGSSLRVRQLRAELVREEWTLQFIPRPTGGGDWYYYPPRGKGPRLRSLAEVQRWKTGAAAVAVKATATVKATTAAATTTTARRNNSTDVSTAPTQKITLHRCPLCGAFCSTLEKLGYHIVAC